MVGETGSGKSTIAKLLTRLMDPTHGAVLLDGIDLREIAQHSLRRSVVLVPQEGFLFHDTIAAAGSLPLGLADRAVMASLG